MRAWAPLLATTALLVFSGPAGADTVGEPQVITDQATETEPAPVDEAPEPDASYDEEDGSDVPAADDGPPAPEPPPDASGRRGEIHVLGATSASSPAATASAPAPAASPSSARTLPFTGPHAGVLALAGLALLAAGFALRRQLPQTF